MLLYYNDNHVLSSLNYNILTSIIFYIHLYKINIFKKCIELEHLIVKRQQKV